MFTQQRLQTPNGVTRRLLALLAVLALIATACGGSSESETAGSADDFGPLIENDVTAADIVSDNADADTDADADDSDATEPSETPVTDDKPAAEVLAFAIQAAEELSYSYEQGLLIDAEFLGQQILMGSDAPFATGQVNGDDMSINADIGTFMVSMFESLGVSANDPAFSGMLDGFSDLELEAWMVDDMVVLDLSDFATTLGELDPAAAGDLALFADGPVSVDLAQLEALGGAAGSTDASAMVGQFAQGAQMTDPADIVAALRNVDALVDAGADTVNGVAVQVYTAQVSFADYADALDQDLTAALDEMGVVDASIDADALVGALESLVVDLTVSIDDDGFVREIVTVVDMGEFANSLFAQMEDGPAGMEFEMVVETWQTFDNYGADFEIVAPDAVDRTSEIAGLLDS